MGRLWTRRLIVLCNVLFVALALSWIVAPGSALSRSSFTAESRSWFHPPSFVHHSFTYTLTMTGTMYVQTPDVAAQTTPVKLAADVEVAVYEREKDGRHLFTLTFNDVRSEGFSPDLNATLAETILSGYVSSEGIVLDIKTPDVLLRENIDAATLFSGLFVPRPPLVSGMDGNRWSVTTSRLFLNEHRPVPVTTTYVRQGTKTWKNDFLETVTRSVHGEFSSTDGTSGRKVGSSLLYIDPDTGLTVASSISSVLFFDGRSASRGSFQTRTTTTTTLELQTRPAPIRQIETSPAYGQSDHATPLRQYTDPAGRYTVSLPHAWSLQPARLDVYTTTISSDDEKDTLTITVLPLSNVGIPSLTIAQLTLTTYQETRNAFHLVDDLTAVNSGGETAYVASYTYDTDDGKSFREWSLFTRYKTYAYSIQYATPNDATNDDAGRSEETFHRIVRNFTYGPRPEGHIDESALIDTLTPYTDPDRRFTLSVPTLWPLVDARPDGSTTTFGEPGGAGYLTVFVRGGARGVTPNDIVTSWKSQWQSEDRFELVHDAIPRPLGGHEGVRFSYRWSTRDGTRWERRFYAVVVADFLYAVAFDYVASRFDRRTELFNRIVSSLTFDEPGEFRVSPSDEPTVLMVGRFMTRYSKGEDAFVSAPASRVDVTVTVDDVPYVTETDEDGYFVLFNLVPTQDDTPYAVTYLEGPLFNFEHIGVNLNHVRFTPLVPGVVTAGTITLTLHPTMDLSLNVEPDDVRASHSPLVRFLHRDPEHDAAARIRALLRENKP